MSPSARCVSESAGSFQGFGHSSGVMMEGGATWLEGAAGFGLACRVHVEKNRLAITLMFVQLWPFISYNWLSMG